MPGYPCCCCQCGDCDCCGAIPEQYAVTLDGIVDGLCTDCDTILNSTFICDVDGTFVCDYIYCDTFCTGILNFCVRMSREPLKIFVELFTIGGGGYSLAQWEVDFTKCYKCNIETDLDLIAHNDVHCDLSLATCHIAPVVPPALMANKLNSSIIDKKKKCCGDKQRPIGNK